MSTGKIESGKCKLIDAVLLKAELPEGEQRIWFETKYIFAYNFYLHDSEWRVFGQNADLNSKFEFSHTAIADNFRSMFGDLMRAHASAMNRVICLG